MEIINTQYEVFALETDSAEYKITFTIDTFQNKDARIIIDIVKEFVSDNECEECGNFGISIKADFYPIGKCCYCGTEN